MDVKTEGRARPVRAPGALSSPIGLLPASENAKWRPRPPPAPSNAGRQKTRVGGRALGGRGQGPLESADLVVANILGPLLIRFAGEIVPCVKRHLVVSGILNELYPEVLAAYEARSFREVSRKTIGEWTTGLLEVVV